MRCYLIAGHRQSLKLEEDESEEADDEDDYRHLVILDDAYHKHKYSEDKNYASPEFQSFLNLIHPVNHF